MTSEDGGQSRSGRRQLTLSYPQHFGRPEDLLDFIELPPFTRRWEKLGLDDEDDLTALQLFIMADPKLGDAIPGTKGIRKLRFAPSHWKSGKRGAVRVLYVHFQEFGIVLLCLAYGKNEIDNISDAAKKHLNNLVAALERELRRRESL
jgi:hypothetical protein